MSISEYILSKSKVTPKLTWTLSCVFLNENIENESQQLFQLVYESQAVKLDFVPYVLHVTSFSDICCYTKRLMQLQNTMIYTTKISDNDDCFNPTILFNTRRIWCPSFIENMAVGVEENEDQTESGCNYKEPQSYLLQVIIIMLIMSVTPRKLSYELLP